MSHQMSFMDILSITSLQVSADGPMPCNSLDGRTTDQCGQDHAHASLSARQAKAQGLTTSATSGHHSNGSFASAALQLSLGSKLHERLGVNGSPWSGLIWKSQDMPSGLPICALRVSGRGTKGNGTTGLPTPSGCSNGGKNNVVGRLDEWGGSSNPFRGTDLGRVRCASFEAWMMGYPMEWASQMVSAMPLSRPSLKRS